MTTVRALAAALLTAAALPQRAHGLRPVAPGWPLASAFAPCTGTCPGEQPHFLHRNGAMTCHHCSTTRNP
jgi:hypothetical protein